MASRTPARTSKKPRLPTPIAVSELGELSELEWSAMRNAMSTLAAMHTMPVTARPTARRKTSVDPARSVLVRISPPYGPPTCCAWVQCSPAHQQKYRRTGAMRGAALCLRIDRHPRPVFALRLGHPGAVIHLAHGVIRDIGSLGGPDAVSPTPNAAGQITGQSYTSTAANPATGIPTLDPFLWQTATCATWAPPAAPSASRTG